MKNDKKNKKGLIICLCIWIVLFALIAVFVTPEKLYEHGLIGGTGSSFAGISVEKENSIDVVALGDSECFSTFSPMQLWNEYGMMSYNCGESGQDMAEAYSMLHTVMKTQKPKVVLLETNALYSSATAMKGVQVAIAERFYTAFPILRFHNVWKNLVQEQHGAEREKGFQIRPSVIPYTGGEYMTVSEATAPIENGNLKYLDKMIALCEKHGAQLVLYSAPSAANYNYAKHVSLSEAAKERGIIYLDLNMQEEVPIDWSHDTVDAGDHVNLSGAEKVTAYLGRFLEETFDLPDHRGEEGHENWQKSGQHYHAITDSIIEEIRNS